MEFQSPTKPLGYGMDSGIGSLPFLGIGFGMILGTITTLVTDNYYVRAVNASSTGSVPPETRLIPACYASWCLPVSLAIFAATSDPSIHWIAPVLAGVPFGLGLIVIFVSVLSYLIDANGESHPSITTFRNSSYLRILHFFRHIRCLEPKC
jgi:hypothetical protein